MNFNQKDFVAQIDTSFITNIYYSPITVLVRMDKDCLRHTLIRAKLVCRALESILGFLADLDAINPKREGK